MLYIGFATLMAGMHVMHVSTIQGSHSSRQGHSSGKPSACTVLAARVAALQGKWLE